MLQCQCEHISHCDDEEQSRTRHAYGLPLRTDEAVKIQTRYGAFVVCDTCHGEGHMA